MYNVIKVLLIILLQSLSEEEFLQANLAIFFFIFNTSYQTSKQAYNEKRRGKIGEKES